MQKNSRVKIFTLPIFFEKADIRVPSISFSAVQQPEYVNYRAAKFNISTGGSGNTLPKFCISYIAFKYGFYLVEKAFTLVVVIISQTVLKFL